MDCDYCQKHITLLELHEKRLDDHNQEFKDVKNTIKEKVSRWIFVVMIGLFSTVQGYQAMTLSKANDTLASIDKKVAVLYISNKLRHEMSSLECQEVEPCLALATNLYR